MIRKDVTGTLKAYLPKKDLEEPIVSMTRVQMWGGVVTLANGWRFELPEMADDTTLPVTVEGRRVSSGEE
nr:putative nitrogen fixation protein NifT [Cupriavidus sp. LEh25]